MAEKHRTLLAPWGVFSHVVYGSESFKPVNDNYGHEIGDVVLKQFSNRLIELSRVEDILIRLGGDEFIVILNELGHDQVTAVKSLQAATARYQDRLNQKYQIEQLQLDVPPSIGSVIIDGSELDPDTLIKQADHMMYEIKQRNKAALRAR
ncbi:GGDEF domain-containing protein [Thiomicrorhabdus sediminis]|uniref:GGDEF domain-containing protein n=1 Tax=Thiomicrorhabdus sediminis TaxID=2580412 RepID=A0A4P9K452_9GAMM|nr:GGDEF domain-containing protein [Thiomicrorhabdus sediminis]QCU89461.1 GGDEF domain-containing protein [Thiomicrorhabdus sediminis]